MTKKMPIIITGIHRSGTTLVSKIIEDNNVFLGKYKDINNESVFFQNINKWLMSINSSSWDNPSSFLESINTENFKLNLDKLKLILHSKMNVQYFGMNNIIFNKKFDNIKNQWGWKDPRNIFTLPFWLKLFPKSKVIIIIRHPIDVVNSLLDRSGYQTITKIEDVTGRKTDAELREELRHLLGTIAVVKPPFDPNGSNGSGSLQ